VLIKQKPQASAPSNKNPKPEWLKIRLRSGENFKLVDGLISDLSLHTVCQEARCPNIFECFANKTATFMILGEICTRHCGFCSVEKGTPLPPDPGEPARLAKAVAKLALDYVVITSVDRDDLPDGGSMHFARTLEAVREHTPDCKIEVLIPDFNGIEKSLENVLKARPDVIGHNVETARNLYKRVRPIAEYSQSLRVLELAALWREKNQLRMKVKSGIMVGLGETMEQILETMKDIADTGCDILTVGQYLSPRKRSLPVARFYTPGEFLFIKELGLEMGFSHVESAPLVRSSYHAKEQAGSQP
jgi:lipoic acid synthetase